MREGDLVLGFDPGGSKSFGWAVCENRDDLLKVHKTGVASDAEEAFNRAAASLLPDARVIAAGVDAPMFWGRAGNRSVDVSIRKAVGACGHPNAAGTVQQVNSLWGACLAQGILLGNFLHEAFPGAEITEAHPKALLWLLGVATPTRPANGVALSELRQLGGVAGTNVSEHERDAVIAALAAWSMCRREPGWRDLFGEEPNPVLLLGTPVSYWMPLP